jgi:hypothetical protein
MEAGQAQQIQSPAIFSVFSVLTLPDHADNDLT